MILTPILFLVLLCLWYLLTCVSLPDPSFLGPVPNLDGCEGHSEHILFGTNVDLSEPSEEGQPQPPSTDGTTEQADPGTDSQSKEEETSKEGEEEERGEDKTTEDGEKGEKGEGEELGSGKEQAQKNTAQVEEDTPGERTEGQNGDSVCEDAQTAKL